MADTIKHQQTTKHGADTWHAFDIRSLSEVVFQSKNGKPADVAVIVPLYNYGNYIEDCLESIANQDIESLSVAVVDDHSSDAGYKVAVKYLERQADRFSTAQVIRHRQNQGPSMARTSGVAWTEEPLLFLLDADNRIRPSALSRLREALSNSRAEFAYPQLWFVGEMNGVGSGDIWSVEHLLDGPYIDMMALIRRDALYKAGGFGVLADDVSWEDHDLWCRFAEQGMRGVFLPELLGEYRIHDAARTKDTLQIVDDLAAEMALRHPDLYHRRSSGKQGTEGRASEMWGIAQNGEPTPDRSPDLPESAAKLEVSQSLSTLREHTAWPQAERLLRDYFDPVWYGKKYPDLIAAGVDLFEHFIGFGYKELRNPCGDFDTTFYLQNNPHVAQQNEIPVIHFLLYGRDQGLSPKIFHAHELGISRGYERTKASVQSQPPKKTCTLLHLFYPELLSELAGYIKNIGPHNDVFVNLVDTTFNVDVHREVFRIWPNARVLISPNRGRDLGGHAGLLGMVDFTKYDLLMFMHSKKSLHLSQALSGAWRRDLLDPLIGSPDTARERIEAMRSNPAIGLTAASTSRETTLSVNFGKFAEVMRLANISPEASDCEFVAGTMFLARTAIAKRLFNVLSKIEFADGDGKGAGFHIDGQYEHAVERLIGSLVKDEGLMFSWV